MAKTFCGCTAAWNRLVVNSAAKAVDERPSGVALRGLDAADVQSLNEADKIQQVSRDSILFVRWIFSSSTVQRR